MKKIYAVLLASLFLAGCQTTQPNIITTQHVPIDIPVSLYNCPVLKKMPDYETLTERQVAQLIVTLQRNNVQCRNSMDAIQKYVDEVKKTVR